jgi:hypothetical protein
MPEHLGNGDLEHGVDANPVACDLADLRMDHRLVEQGPHDVGEQRAGVLLERQRRRVVARVRRVERRGWLQPLEVGADGGGIREAEITVDDGRNLARGTDRAPVRRGIAGDDGNDGHDLVRQVLGQRGDDHLARVHGQGDAIDLQHDRLLE